MNTSPADTTLASHGSLVFEGTRLSNRNRFARAALVSLALLLAACSGSDSTDSVAADNETTAAPTTEASTTTTTESTTTTTTPPETSTTAAVPDVDPNDPVVVNYCAATVAADDLAESSDYADIQAFQDVMDGQLSIITAIEFPAPIASDLETIASGLQQMSDAAGSAGSIDDIIAVLGPIGDSPEFLAAGDNIDAFEAEYCPEAAVDSPATTDNPLGITEADIRALLETDAGRESIAQGITTTSSLTLEEATCFIDSSEASTLVGLFELATGAATEPSSEVQAGLFAALDVCNLDLTAFGG